MRGGAFGCVVALTGLAGLSMVTIAPGCGPRATCVEEECYEVCELVCDFFGCWRECYTECYCVATAVVECVSNRDCAAGRACVGGECVTLTLAGKGLCESCTSHASCYEQGALCVALPSGEKVCGRACRADRECPAGMVCSEIQGSTSNQCLPETDSCNVASVACVAHAECGPDQICAQGVCQAAPAGCTESSQCAANQRCDDAGSCVPAECEASEDCNEGQICLDKGCHATCLANSHCPAKRVCSAGVCTPLDKVECRLHTDCAEGRLCQNATCKVECSADTPCPAGFLCKNTYCDVDPSTPRTCAEDAQCLAGEKCESSVCVLR